MTKCQTVAWKMCHDINFNRVEVLPLIVSPLRTPLSRQQHVRHTSERHRLQIVIDCKCRPTFCFYLIIIIAKVLYNKNIRLVAE